MSEQSSALHAAASILQHDKDWLGWEFYVVTAVGGHSPAEVGRYWTADEVFDAYWDICLMEALR